MGELPLRGAARSEEGRGSNWESFRCAGLLDGGNGGGSTWGSFRCAGLLDGGMEEAANAQLKEGEGSLGGAPAARSCPIEGGRSLFLGELPLRGAVGRSLFLGELPLRGAAQLKEGGASFWGSCRCAGLLN